VPGRSLAGFRDGASGAVHPSPVYSEAEQNPYLEKDGPVTLGPMSGLIADSLHYVLLGDGREQLFDIRRDPFEIVDLADSVRYTADLKRMRHGRANATTRALANR
jgi:hypothetical protein